MRRPEGVVEEDITTYKHHVTRRSPENPRFLAICASHDLISAVFGRQHCNSKGAAFVECIMEHKVVNKENFYYVH